MKQEAYRLRDVCDKLDISVWTAYRYIKLGKPPFDRAFKVGESWRVPVESLSRLLAVGADRR